MVARRRGERQGVRGSLAAEHKRCGKPNCRCALGELHGPYYYRRWRDESGMQRREYVPRNRVGVVRAALEKARANSPRELMRRLRELHALTREKSNSAARGLDQELGRYWHGSTLRQRRSFPQEERDRIAFRASQAKIQQALGWKISEDDFVQLQRMIRSERKRRNRLGLPWAMRDPATGQEVLVVGLDLMQLPSYREHRARRIGGFGK